MTIPLIITICILLLIAYVFDVSASKTKIPSIILLLLLGFGLKQIIDLLSIEIPDLVSLLPLLGTVGLILIVLEGSLELDLNKEKLKPIGISSLLALLPMLLMGIILAYSFQYFENVSLKLALANAIPLCIISSAIAIPSARNLSPHTREFVTYESSLSDIFGVIFFNFITLNDAIETKSVVSFIGEMFIILFVSILATGILAYLISHIKHHIKFAPIILLIVLIYAISKLFHLPGLIFILIFGLALQNLELFKGYSIIQKLKPEILETEVRKFAEITSEFAFLIRALFFLLFGFLIKFEDICNLSTLPWAFGIVALIFMLRAIFLKFLKLPLSPLLYIAPRGLITILLFLTIPIEQKIPLVNNALLIQVILLCSIIMMIGLMKPNSIKEPHPLTLMTDNEDN
ncbi:MAG: sodium:proton antiporter [Bacteroidia bacterium]|nr:sodium:proton antiporter [Bacteroidia bacterium]